MPKIRPIGHREMFRLVWEDKMDGDDWQAFPNQRKAHCKVCGSEIPKGQGASWRRYAKGDPNNIRFTRNHLCQKCQAQWGNLALRTLKSRTWPHPFKRFLPRCWSGEKVREILGYTLLEDE